MLTLSERGLHLIERVLSTKIINLNKDFVRKKDIRKIQKRAQNATVCGLGDPNDGSSDSEFYLICH